MGNTLSFNREDFEAWFIANAQMIYDLTGVAHYNAQNIGLLKMIFILNQRIEKLEAKKTRARKNG